MVEQSEQIIKRKTRKIRWKFFVTLLITHFVFGLVGWKIGIEAEKVQVVGLISELNTKKANMYAKKVAELIVVPKTEVPKVVILNNVDEIVKQQPFFIGAKNGDVFLVYNDNKKAIVYRPDENIIVNVGPVYNEPIKSQPTQVQNNETTSVQDVGGANKSTDQKKTTEATTTKSIKN